MARRYGLPAVVALVISMHTQTAAAEKLIGGGEAQTMRFRAVPNSDVPNI
jgi:hypothetical protein